MKRVIAALLAGVVLGGAGTGLAVTSRGRYEVPRGYAGTFTGLPQLLCVNKRLSESNGKWAPSGTVSGFCPVFPKPGVTTAKFEVFFDWKHVTVIGENGVLILRLRLAP